MAYGIKHDKMHGAFRSWHENGQVYEEASYVNGNEHGLTNQYDHTGCLPGSYTMVHGTGADLWFADDGSLAEERQYKDGLRHGYERWWNGDNATVGQEAHYWQGEARGIFRKWHVHGRRRASTATQICVQRIFWHHLCSPHFAGYKLAFVNKPQNRFGVRTIRCDMKACSCCHKFDNLAHLF